jgi:hypothetical protein
MSAGWFILLRPQAAVEWQGVRGTIMGAYLCEFQFADEAPTAEKFRSHFTDLYSPRCLDTYEVEGRRVLVTCLFDPCGVHYLHSVMGQLGGRSVGRSGEPLDHSLPGFTSTSWRLVPILTKLGVYARWLTGRRG